MNDLVLNLLPMDGNLGRGPTISSGMNRATFNSVDFCSGRYLQVPYIPRFFGAPPNWGGGWSGSGILGTYYANSNFTGSTFQRTDVRIDMPPTTVLPGGSLATDPVFGAVAATNFSAKWVGSLIPKYTQTYTFRVRTGGTLTLKVGGSTVATATSSSGWVSANQSFTANQSVAVEVDMVQGTGPWSAQVHWLSTDASPFPEEAIGPAAPAGANLPNDDQDFPANGALIAQYETTIGHPPGPALDPSGWPTGDFALEQMSTPNIGGGSPAFPNVGYASDGRTGVWTISFNGSAQLYTNNTGQFLIGHDDGLGRTAVTLNSLTYYSYGQTLPLSAQVYHSGTGTGYNPSPVNQTIALLDLRAGGWDNIAFQNTDRLGQGAPGGPLGSPHANGVTNVVCMRPASIGATTSLPAGTVISPPLLTAMSPYVCIRNLGSYLDLDFVASLTSPYTDWGKRPTPVFNIYASDTNQYPNTSMPWEYRIMACNQSGKDLYVNLPQTASGNASDPDYTSSYLYQIANLLKNGSTFNGVNYPGLLPHLCVYIEYGNENWNYNAYGPPQGPFHNVGLIVYNNKQANTADWQQYFAMGGSVVGPDDNSMNVALWSALKVKDASDLFRFVYGDAAMPGGPSGYNPDPRIRPIYEWQYGGSSFGNSGAPASSLAAIQSYFGVQANRIYWGGGGGWYLIWRQTGANPDAIFGALTPAGALGVWSTGQPAGYTNSLQQDVDILARFGMHHVGYEGGFGIGNGDDQSDAQQQKCANDSRIIPYVKLALDGYFQAGCSLPVVFYATGGAYGFQSDYSVTDGIWDEPPYATAPPKLQAYLTAEASLPAAPSAPAAWQVVPFTIVSGQGYQNGQSMTQTCVVPTAGFYIMTVTTEPQWTYATGTLSFFIDGVQAGGYTTSDHTIAQSHSVPVYLGPGVHGVAVSFSGLNPSNTQIAISWGIG